MKSHDFLIELNAHSSFRRMELVPGTVIKIRSLWLDRSEIPEIPGEEITIITIQKGYSIKPTPNDLSSYP